MQNLDEIIKLAEVEAHPMGLLVVDARLCQQGRIRILEVSICRKNGRISLSDCEELSRKLDKVLDEQPPAALEGSYMLEVQSPGLDRQLKTDREFDIFTGEIVEVRVRESIPGLGDAFIGKLESKAGEVLTVSKPEPKILPSAGKNRKKGNAKQEKSSGAKVAAPDSISLEMSKIFQVRLYPVEVEAVLAEEADAELELNAEEEE